MVSKSRSPVKASAIKHDGRAAKTAPVAAVDVLGAAAERGVRDTEPPLPDCDPDPPPPLLRGDSVLDSGCDENFLRTNRS